MQSSERKIMPALRRGLFCRCPNCGKGDVFRGYLRVVERCSHCSEDLSHQRADDAPPYFTIFIVGHIIIPLLVAFEIAFHPPFWLHAVIWIPATTLLSLAVLRPVKGTVVALQWALRMDGFDDGAEHRADGIR